LHLPVRNKDIAMADNKLDDFIAAAARALELPLEPDWQPAVKTNLEVTLRHAATVAEFALPDEAEPAPVFKA
jgi:1-carboxybiuret hydrolase subunit AtzG-like